VFISTTISTHRWFHVGRCYHIRTPLDDAAGVDSGRPWAVTQLLDISWDGWRVQPSPEPATTPLPPAYPSLVLPTHAKIVPTHPFPTFYSPRACATTTHLHACATTGNTDARFSDRTLRVEQACRSLLPFHRPTDWVGYTTPFLASMDTHR